MADQTASQKVLGWVKVGQLATVITIMVALASCCLYGWFSTPH